jgi:hypothetical protein
MMQSDSNAANLGEAEDSAAQDHAVAICWEREAVESVLALEAGMLAYSGLAAFSSGNSRFCW